MSYGERPRRFAIASPTLWQRLRTFAGVTLVTVLIWVWADAETQKDDLLNVDAAAKGSRSAGLSEAEYLAEDLPVLIAQPADEHVILKAEQKTLKKVRIVGPVGAIERVRSGEVSIYAFVVVPQSDFVRHPKGGTPDHGEVTVEPLVQIGPSGLGLRVVTPSDAARLRVTVTLP